MDETASIDNTVKAVVFDLGKVLLEFDYRHTVRKVAERCRLDDAELLRLFDRSPLTNRYEKGLITTDEFYDAIVERTGYSGAKHDFIDAFGGIFTPIQPMIDLHARLYERGVKTYVFSNTNEIAIAHVKRQFPFFAEFDGYVYSYRYHSMKPEARLYEAVERETGLNGANLLYFDDRPENVEAGLAHGWRAVLHETPEKSAQAVREAGLFE